MASVMRLLVRVCRETGHKDAFVMVISPDLEYLSKNLDNPLENFTSLHWGEEFSGLVFFYDLTGEFVDGYKVTNGEVFQLFSQTMVANQPQLRSDDFTCIIIVDSIVWFVNDVYQNTQILDIFIYCFSVGGGGTPGGNPGGPGGGPGPGVPGGPGSNLQPPPKPDEDEPVADECAPNASRIFTNATMNCNEWEQLERLVNELKNNCMGEVLFNELRESGSIGFSFNYGTGSRFNRTNQTMSLSRTGGTAHLFHELFHAVQPAAGGYGQLNREIEAFLAEYLFARTQGWFQPGNVRYEFFREHLLGMSIAGLADFIDATGNRLSRFSQTDIDNHIRHNERVGNVLELGPYELFRRSRREDGTPTAYVGMHFSTATSGDQNFRTLQRISINCR